MGPESVIDGLDEGGAFAGQCPISSCADDFEDRERIVPINGYAWDTERFGLCGKPGSGGLSACRGGDGPLII